MMTKTVEEELKILHPFIYGLLEKALSVDISNIGNGALMRTLKVQYSTKDRAIGEMVECNSDKFRCLGVMEVEVKYVDLNKGEQMTIAEMVEKSYQMSKEKGWHEKERSPLEIHMLIVSEVAEATEEVRKGAPPVYQCGPTDPAIRTPDMKECWNGQLKPEGELIELADAMIRIADYCGHKDWDLSAAIEMKMKYNKTRPHRHGGKAY